NGARCRTKRRYRLAVTRRRVEIGAAVTALWLSLGVLSATQLYASLAVTPGGSPFPFTSVLVWQEFVWLIWAVLTPVVVAAARYRRLAWSMPAVTFHVA